MKTKDFNELLRMAAGYHSLPLKETYVEFTWWDDKFLPLITTDRNWKKSESILVFGSAPCNFWKRGSARGSVAVPCGFYVTADEVRPENVVHRPMVLDEIMDQDWILEMETIGFLFENSPRNYYVDINPFRTRAFRNWIGETVLCLYADDGGNESNMPFSRMRPERIQMFDDQSKAPDGKGDDWHACVCDRPA